jgi:hypothetical protein
LEEIKMEKLYIVCWGSGSVGDHDNAHAYSGVVGAYRNKDDAKQALENYKNETLEEVYEDLDPDRERPDIWGEPSEVQVYGSVDEEYFEIDYTLGTEPVELYIGISETVLN